MSPIKVLIIEDSKMMQELLHKILSQDSDIKVIGKAEDPLIARELIKQLNPDVLTLDIMLPHMDGLTFLKNVMRLHPMPVIIVSMITETGSAIGIEALAIGALDYLQKPKRKTKISIDKFSKKLIKSIKFAALANVQKKMVAIHYGAQFQKIIYDSAFLRNQFIIIGASTGGIEAIETILLQLPQVFPPILIVQHMKKEFNIAFAERIRKSFGLTVITPENQTELRPGCIYLAPGDKHFIMKKTRERYVALLDDSPPVLGHKPSIDKLFLSAALIAGPYCIGILLTGMGKDGAKGLKAIHDAGGTTLVQDEESSVVWGIPSAAIRIDAVDFVESLDNIPKKILQILETKALEMDAHENINR